MDRIMGVVSKVPLWVRTVIASVVIICVAVVVDHFVQEYIYINMYTVVDDDFTNVFQIDSVEKKDNELVLNGWVFKLDEDSIENDFEIILYDYNNNKDYYLDVEDVVRNDVNEYFLCEYDYSNSGFVARIKLRKINLNETNYEILIRPKENRKGYKTGIYISKGEMVFAKPEEFIALDVEGTGLEEIVNAGVLRVYRPDVGMYVYQYDEKLYWITNENYYFEEDKSTYVQYHLATTQIDNLPQHRLDNKWFFDDLGFYFENNEIVQDYGSGVRVTECSIPRNYSVMKIWTGYYVQSWKWMQYFRPWYEFE